MTEEVSTAESRPKSSAFTWSKATALAYLSQIPGARARLKSRSIESDDGGGSRSHHSGSKDTLPQEQVIADHPFVFVRVGSKNTLRDIFEGFEEEEPPKNNDDEEGSHGASP